MATSKKSLEQQNRAAMFARRIELMRPAVKDTVYEQPLDRALELLARVPRSNEHDARELIKAALRQLPAIVGATTPKVYY